MKKIVLSLAYLLIFSSIDIGQTLISSVSLVFCEESKNPVATPASTLNKTSVPIEQPITANSNKPDNSMLIVIVQIIASIIGGGLAGAAVNIYFSERQSKKELKALIVVFAAELTLAFARCVKYYDQSRKKEVSYSGLFDFTNASILSRFATVNNQPEVMAAIVNLKSHYFQIGRHVEEASKFAAQADRLAREQEESQRLMKAAFRAQGTALAFFSTSYEDIKKDTLLIIEEAKRMASSKVVDALEKDFGEAAQKKLEIDEATNKAINSKPQTSPTNGPKD